MRTKLFAYITAISTVTAFFVQPALAQQYNFGTENNGITWQQLWDSSWQKTIPQTATATFIAGAESVITDHKVFLVGKRTVTVAEKEATRSAVETSLEKAAESKLAKTMSKEAAEKAAKEIVVNFAKSAALKGLTIVGAAETVLEVLWPADINWQARGTPLICVNSTTDKYPKCFAYFVTKSSSAGIYWEALDPERHSFAGDVTKYFFDVPLDVTFLLDLAFGRPEPKCALKEPNSAYQSIATIGSKIYRDLQPGENKFTMGCFTAGEQSLAKKIVQTGLNGVATVLNVITEGYVGMGKLAYSLLPGGLTSDDVLTQAAPTLTALLDGTYTPPWPIPQDIAHQASVVIAVNSPVAPKPIAPTLEFSADPYTVTPTRSSILSWISDNADTCDTSGGWSGPKNLSGKEAVTPSMNTTYTLTCKGKGGSVEKSVTVTILNQRPVGRHDDVDNNTCRTWGWAYDPDTSSQSIEVHIYRDGPAGEGGAILNKFVANVSRPDVNTTKGISGNHGFDVNLSPFISDGKNHSLYVYGIDTAGGTNSLLNNSPKIIQCSAPQSAPGSPPPSVDIKAE